MSRRVLSVALSILVLVSAASAANFVSGFTIGGSVVGGSTQQAIGTVTVNRDPNDNGPIAIDVLVPSGVGLVCKTQQGWYSYICYLPAGTNTMQVALVGGFTSTDWTATITARVDGNPSDPGVSAQLTVLAMRSSVSISPGSIIGDGVDVAKAHVTITNGTPASDISIYLTVSPAYAYPTPKGSSSNPVTLPAGSTSVDVNIAGSTVSSSQTVTVTPSFGPNPGTAQLTINPGNTPSSTQMGCGCEGPPEEQIGMPIDVISGNTWVKQQDYSVPGLGALAVVRTWNSLWTVNSPPQTAGLFGHSWTSNLEERIQVVNPTVTKYWEGDGKVIQYNYDSLNQVYVLVSPPEEHIALVYDPILQQYTVQYTNGDRRLFNSAGYLTAILDRNGNQTSLTYDASNRLTQVTDPAGRTLTFTYGSPSSTQVQSVADSVGTVATYTYDASARLTQVAYPDTHLTFTYNTNSLLLNVQDAAGKVLEAHTYDSSRRGLTSQRANGVESISISGYNPGYTYFTNSLGGASQVNFYKIGTGYYVRSYYSSGCATCTLVPGVHTFTYALDTSGNRSEIVDGNNHWTYQSFDALGNLTRWKRALSGSNYVERDYTYNSLGQVLTATDPLGYTTTNTYDANGNLLSTTTPSPDGVQPGSTTSFTYDSHGLLLTVTDPLNHTTTMTYTPAGLVATVTDAQNNITSYTYDARGNRTGVTDALSHATSFAYDARNRLTTITYPDQSTTSFAYDLRGRRTSVTDGNGKSTTYAYDDADRLTSVSDAASNVTHYGYDNESHLTSITDASNHATSFTYTNGWLTRTTFPSTLYESYAYDYLGNLTSKTDRKNQTTSYLYDSFDRVYYYYVGSYISNYFDNAGHLTKVTDGSSNTWQFAYDHIGRLTQTQATYSFVGGRTFTTSYTYDAAGNRTTMTDPANGVTNYTYDSLNRLTGLNDFNSNSFGFSYDALSRRTQLTRPNGVTTNYAYDNLSRLLSVLHQVGLTTLDGATYTYDNAGNRTSKVNQLNAVTENYTYDQIYQLTQVVQGLNTTEAYTYDAVGNRLSTVSDSGWTYDSSNHLTSRPGVTYTYDNNGNTATKVDASGTTTYAWDYLNRLTSVTLPGSGGTVTFKYDPFGRRIQKVSPASTTNYIYDSANVIEEVDGTGTVLARYSQGSGIDQPLSDVVAGVAKFYDADGLGSITSLADISASLTDTYTTDTFGKTTASSGSTRNPFRYTARDLDSETGLYYYRARYYDPAVGRFLSEDRIRFRAGSNFYVYVGNGPVNFIDPFGLSSLIFNPRTGTLTVVNGAGQALGTFPAGNNAQNGSRGRWPDGTYAYDYHTTHPDDAPNSPFGSNGNYVFRVPKCRGCGVHSGRANSTDRAGRSGVDYATNGCIRTTDEATDLIYQLSENGDPLTSLTVSSDPIPTNTPAFSSELEGAPAVYLPDVSH